MNLLDKLCKELGVEVGKQWEGNDGYKYRISKNGEIFLYDKRGFYAGSRGFGRWESVFSGELKPVLKPKEGEFYFYTRPDLEKGWGDTYWTGDSIDYYRLNNNLIFKTIEEAIETSNKMIKALKGEK